MTNYTDVNAEAAAPATTSLHLQFCTGFGQFDTRKDSSADYEGITGKEIVAMLRDPPSVPKAKAQWFIPSTYRASDGRVFEAQRERGEFWFLCLDEDGETENNLCLDEIDQTLEQVCGPVARMIYSTRSSTDTRRKWRALIPLWEPISGPDYADTVAAFNAALIEASAGVLIPDPALEREAQLIYLPNRGEHYEHRVHNDNPLDLTPDHEIVKRREAIRAERRRDEEETRKRRERKRAEALANPGGNASIIEAFNGNTTVADELGRYGYTMSRNGRDRKSPNSSTGSYAVRDYGYFWISLSGSDGALEIGNVSPSDARIGDAFDLFVHYEHNGDFRAAVRAYAKEIGEDHASRQVQRAIDTARPIAPVAGEPVAAVPAMEPGRAREVLRSEVEAGLGRDGVTLVEATLGLGKTRTMIGALGGLLDTDPNGAVVVAVPMHRLGRQIVEDLRQALPGRRMQQLYGAEAQDPDDPSQTVCRQLDAYREQAALLLDTADVCTPCPFAGECKHLASVGARADVYIVSHERLKSAGTPLHSDQRLLATVVDESPLSALINVSSRPVPLAKLMAAPTAMANDPTQSSQADLEAFRAKLGRTIEAHGPGYLRCDALEEWTAAEASAARGLEWRRKIDDGEDPDVLHNKTVTTASRVFGEILRSLEDGVAQNGRVRIQRGEYGLEIVLSGLRSISAAYRSAPVLMLDATAEPEVAARLAGQDLAHHAQVGAREQLKVRQATDMTGAKSFFFVSGEPTGNVARVRSWIRMQALESGRTAVIGNKDTIAALDLPEQVQTGHFNALRGLNEMEGADHLVVIGRTQPPPAGIERHVAAIWGEPVTGDLNRNGTVKRTETGPDGQARIIERPGTTHDDPRGQMMLSLIRDAEVSQAIGRLRGVNREHPALVTLISDALVEHRVEPVQLRPAIRAAGIAWPMLARGVAFLSPAQAARAYPDLYASKQAAAKVFGPKSDWATFPIEAPYGKGCPVVEIKVPRARETTMAMIAPWVSDAETEIRRYLPTASVITADSADAADQVTAIAPPAPTPARTVDAGAQPAQVHELHSPGWHEAHRRHRAKADSRGRVAMAVDHRIEATGIWLRHSTNQVAVALHETSDAAKIASMLDMTPAQVEAALSDLFFLGLVDHDNRLDGPLALRKLVRATGTDSPIVAAFIETRRQPMRMQA